MHKTHVSLEEWQYEALKSEATQQGRSISELLRRILAEYLNNQSLNPKFSIIDIEGLGNDLEASGQEHDQFLYDAQRHS